MPQVGTVVPKSLTKSFSQTILAAIYLQDHEFSHGSQHVHPIPVHGGCGTRPDGVALHQAGVVDFPFPLPEDFPVLLIQTQNALETLVALRAPEIRNEHTAAGNGGAGEPAMNGCPPTDLESFGGERLHDARLVPDSQTTMAAPLGPIFCRGRAGAQQRKKKHYRDFHSYPGYGIDFPSSSRELVDGVRGSCARTAAQLSTTAVHCPEPQLVREPTNALNSPHAFLGLPRGGRRACRDERRGSLRVEREPGAISTELARSR